MRSLRLQLAAALLLAAFAARAEPAVSVAPLTILPGGYGGGRVYVPVRIGNVMGQMRLDTGASTTRVKRAPWNMDFRVIAQSVSSSAFGSVTHCDDVEAANVAIKASQGNDIARGKYEVSRCAASDGDDLLGLDFFKNTRVTLDFARREMTFFGQSRTNPAQPFRLLGPEKKLVGVDLKIGEVATIGLFDTGAEICAVDLSFFKKHRRLFSLVKNRAQASEASGRKIMSRLFKIREIALAGGLSAHDVYALVYDFGPLRAALGAETPIILGYNLLGRFGWTLDLRNPGAPMWEARPN